MMNDDSPGVRALMAELRVLSARLPGSEEYVMVHHPAFRVGRKPFLVAGMMQSATLSVNLGLDAQSGLLDDARFSKTPYMGHNGWVTIERRRLKAAELADLVTESWRRVAGKKALAEFSAAAKPKPKKPAKWARHRLASAAALGPMILGPRRPGDFCE